MAKYHHERLDGRGYPDGLTDLQIPLGAKIVTLADSFDAMTTNRPYKTRRTFDEVIDDFRRNTGTQFDPIVVVAFCRALLKELNGETKERKFLKMLGKNYLDAERHSAAERTPQRTRSEYQNRRRRASVTQLAYLGWIRSTNCRSRSFDRA